MIFSSTSLSLNLVALSSSIQSGWFQCSLGMTPNSVRALVVREIRLDRGCYSGSNLRRSCNALLKFLGEWLVIQKDVRVTIFSVEASFYLAYALHCSIKVRVSSQYDESRVCALPCWDAAFCLDSRVARFCFEMWGKAVDWSSFTIAFLSEAEKVMKASLSQDEYLS